MSNYFNPASLIFPAWIKIHKKNLELEQRLNKIRELRVERSKLNFSIPIFNPDSEYFYTHYVYDKIRIAEGSDNAIPVEKAYEAHKELILYFTSIVHRTFWSRWIYIERALEVASLSGDMLFGAICLRTLAEDVWALSELANFEKQLVRNKKHVEPEDLTRIRRHGDLLLCRFLANMKDAEFKPKNDLPEPFENYELLRNSFQALNDYVHPNYGSHLLALYPERSSGLLILLDAYIVVYEHFLRLPFVYEKLEEPSFSLSEIKIQSWKEEGDFVLKKVCPTVKKYRQERNLPNSESDPAIYLKLWLKPLNSPDLEIEWENDPSWFDNLLPLAKLIGKFNDKQFTNKELCNRMLDSNDLALPMREIELLELVNARQATEELEKNMPTSKNVSDLKKYTSWLKFFTAAIKSTILYTNYKISLMKWSAIRQCNDRNPIGAMIACRSFIEHYAVLCYFGQRLEKSWDDFLKKATVSSSSFEPFERLEQEIARFLSGTKGSSEYHTTWKSEWKNQELDKAINLRSATEECLDNSILSEIYDHASKVIHGNLSKGIQLATDQNSHYVIANLSRTLFGIDQICYLQITLDPIRKSILTLQRLESFVNALEQNEVNFSEVLTTVASAKTNLIRGKHFWGSGELNDPYRFAAGLEYYDSFYTLCEILNLDTDSKKLIRLNDGKFYDVVTDKNGNQHYFLINSVYLKQT